jgi:hypothetical protein
VRALISSTGVLGQGYIRGVIKGIAKEHKLKLGKVMPVFRFVVTGMGVGGVSSSDPCYRPPMPRSLLLLQDLGETAELIGKEQVLLRLEDSQKPGF